MGPVPIDAPPDSPVFTTDPAATRRRLAALDDYYSRAVLADGEFVCEHAAACEASAKRPGTGFFEAQGSCVSPQYDVAEDGVPMRLLVVAMETGRERSRVTVEERTTEVRQLVGRPWRSWNPHMRGVGLALRLAFGGNLGDDERGLHLATSDGPVHVLDAYAMANLLLCSAVQLGSVTSRSTSTMRRNCAPHLGATIDILEPTLGIPQGTTVSAPFESLVDVVDTTSPNVAVCERNGRTLVWVNLHHPTYAWSWLTHEYLHRTAAPAITVGRRVARAIAADDPSGGPPVPGRPATGRRASPLATGPVSTAPADPSRPDPNHDTPADKRAIDRPSGSNRPKLTPTQVRERALRSVLDELTARGIAARRVNRPDATVDISLDAGGDRGERAVKVKARYGGTTWQASTTQGRPGSEPTAGEDHFWVLVNVRADPPSHYVVPDWWFRKDIHEMHAAYLKRNGDRRPVSPDSTHHAINDARVAGWRDRWDLLAGPTSS